jgi:Rap1a immunity proteins
MTPFVRRTSLIAPVCAFLLSAPSSAIAFTGNEWRGFPERERQKYVMGIVDAWSNGAAMTQLLKESDPTYKLSEVEQMLAPIINCTKERTTYGQVIAIVEKHMNQNPEHWHYDMASNIWTALYIACPGPKTK